MDIRRFVRRVDELQQRNRFLAFPFAVIKKFGDDQGGDLSALIAYYGFLSLFPLLLVLFTVLGFVLPGHAGLQHDLKTSALADFPIIGDQISRIITSVRGSGFGLAIGIAGTFFWGGSRDRERAVFAKRLWPRSIAPPPPPPEIDHARGLGTEANAV